MYVYVWKHNEAPFYVGMSKTLRRTNPLNSGARGWFCKQTLEKIGPKNVVVELRTVETQEEAAALERSLIQLYGRIQCGTGTLTNLRPGGDGVASMSPEGRAATSKRLKENNPMHNPEMLANAVARMRAPDVRAKFIGENNPAKRLDVRAKLLKKWEDPEYRAKQSASRKGKKKHTEEFKQKARERLLDPNNPMRNAHVVLNSDPAIAAKRLESIRSKEVRLKHKKNAEVRWADPAKREALAEKMRVIWEKRKAENPPKERPQKRTKEELSEYRRALLKKRNADPEYTAKRIAALQAASDAISAGVNKTQAKRKATLATPEVRAKLRRPKTAEHNQKVSEAKKRWWAERKAITQSK